MSSDVSHGLERGDEVYRSPSMVAIDHHFLVPQSAWHQPVEAKTAQVHVRGQVGSGLLRGGVRVVVNRPSYGLDLHADDQQEGWSHPQQSDPNDDNPNEPDRTLGRAVKNAGRVRY
jgi:hypothetical protein